MIVSAEGWQVSSQSHWWQCFLNCTFICHPVLKKISGLWSYVFTLSHEFVVHDNLIFHICLQAPSFLLAESESKVTNLAHWHTSLMCGQASTWPLQKTKKRKIFTHGDWITITSWVSGGHQFACCFPLYSQFFSYTGISRQGGRTVIQALEVPSTRPSEQCFPTSSPRPHPQHPQILGQQLLI